jgi:hypothetical protein
VKKFSKPDNMPAQHTANAACQPQWSLIQGVASIEMVEPMLTAM